MSGPEQTEGGCLCGAIRYRIAGPVSPAVHCHCTTCRRASGAPLVTWVVANQGDFRVTKGEPAVYRSSEHGERAFCRGCGAQLTFRTSRRPDDVDITVGSLDRPERHPPDHHIWAENRVTWLRLDEHLPTHAREGPS